MAVEARRMNLLPSQFILPNRDFLKQTQPIIPDLCNHNMINNTHIATTTPTPTTPAGPLPNYAYSALKPPPERLNFAVYNHSDWGSGKADSGLTCNNFPAAAPARKRTRRSVYHQEQPAGPFSPGLLDHEIINSHIHQQRSEIDRFIAIHTEKVRMEMEERKKRQSGMLVRAIEERVVKRLKEKDEEIERMGKLNWVLQERVKRLCMENQLWRDLAETNEATVNSLRTNLEQVLFANVGEEARQGNAPAEEEEEDAQSSCGSNDYEQAEESCGGGGGGGGGQCRKCGAADSRVLVLPCRHLCLCTMCGSTLHTCPVCNSAINASVHVNFS